MRQELARKGIDREIIDQVLALYEDQDPGEAISLVLERRYPQWRQDERVRRRAVAALQRLGYSYEQIRSALGGLEEE